MQKSNIISRQDRLSKLVDKIKNTDVGGNTSAGFWSAPEGRTVIRILPEVHDMEYFFQTVGRHNFPPDGKKHCYCPRFTSEGLLPCPVCELIDQLYKSGDKDNKALASQLRIRKMYWMNIIVRDKNGDKGPFIYTPGVTVFNQITTLIGDPDYGDIMDVEDGIDITIERTGTGMNTEYQVTPRRNSSPLHSDPNKVAEWLNAAKSLKYVEVTDDPAEDKKIIDGRPLYILPYNRIVREFGLDGDIESIGIADSDDEEEEELVPVKKAKSRSYETPAQKKSKVVVEEDDEDDVIYEDEEDEIEEELEEEEEEEEIPVNRKQSSVTRNPREEIMHRTARRSLRK
jgi:hypothetical protein